MRYTHLFFDMDGTVTRAKSLITKEMRETLGALQKSGRDVIIVSGQTKELIEKQTEGFPCLYLCQNGNHAVDVVSGEELWRRDLSADEKEEIWKHILSIPRTWEVSNEDDLVQDRGSQISYSLLGHNEDVEKKEAFDPDTKRRATMLAEHPFNSKTVEVKIGGTTTFDYSPKGKNKGYNVAQLIEQKGWNKAACVYVGDRLFPGGNDDTVLGVIDTHPVKNPDETLVFLKELLAEK